MRGMQALALAVFAVVCAPGALARCHHLPSSKSSLSASSSVAPSSSSAIPSSSSILSSVLSSILPSITPSSTLSSEISSSTPSSIASSSIVSSSVSSSAPPLSISSSVAPSSAVSSIASVSSSVAPPVQTFACDGSGYLVQSNVLRRLDFETGVLTPISTDLGININSLGYNVLDNYLYGFDSDNRVVRIDAQGNVIPVTVEDSVSSSAGEIDADGFYWISGGGADFTQIDLRPGSHTYGAYLASSGIDNLGYTITDWVDLGFQGGNGGYLYTVATGVTPDTNTILRFSKTTYEWEVVGTDAFPASTGWGAMYGFEQGQAIFATNSLTGRVWRFGITNGQYNNQRDDVVASPSEQPNDGAACRTGPPPPSAS